MSGSSRLQRILVALIGVLWIAANVGSVPCLAADAWLDGDPNAIWAR